MKKNILEIEHNLEKFYRMEDENKKSDRWKRINKRRIESEKEFEQELTKIKDTIAMFSGRLDDTVIFYPD